VTRLVSLGAKIQQLEGLLDTKDVNDWENTFLHNVCDRTAGGLVTRRLSDKQIDRIEELWARHFA